MQRISLRLGLREHYPIVLALENRPKSLTGSILKQERTNILREHASNKQKMRNTNSSFHGKYQTQHICFSQNKQSTSLTGDWFEETTSQSNDNQNNNVLTKIMLRLFNLKTTTLCQFFTFLQTYLKPQGTKSTFWYP